MNTRAAAVAFGAAATAAIAVWLLAQIYLSSIGGFAVAAVSADGARVVFLVQLIVVSLAVPWLAAASPVRDIVRSLALVVLIPLPLVTFVWLTTGIPARSLLLAEVAVAVGAAALALSMLLARRLPALRALALCGLQIAGIALAWQWHGPALQWLGVS